MCRPPRRVTATGTPRTTKPRKSSVAGPLNRHRILPDADSDATARVSRPRKPDPLRTSRTGCPLCSELRQSSASGAGVGVGVPVASAVGVVAVGVGVAVRVGLGFSPPPHPFRPMTTSTASQTPHAGEPSCGRPCTSQSIDSRLVRGLTIFARGGQGLPASARCDPCMRSVRVFHIDDSPAYRRLVALWLANHPDVEHVGELPSVGGCLDSLVRAAPDVVLLDTMEGMGDAEAAQRVRAAVPLARVVLYSGYVGLVPSAALDIGADAYLRKEANDDSLVALLRELRNAPARTGRFVVTRDSGAITRSA